MMGASWSKFAWSWGVVGFTAETFQNPVLEKIKSCWFFLYGYLHSCKRSSLKTACFLLIARPMERCHHFSYFKHIVYLPVWILSASALKKTNFLTYTSDISNLHNKSTLDRITGKAWLWDTSRAANGRKDVYFSCCFCRLLIAAKCHGSEHLFIKLWRNDCLKNLLACVQGCSPTGWGRPWLAVENGCRDGTGTAAC